ncbi:MAG: acetoacetate decarboxylase family protein [Casimicrobiaceae bacterium]
MPAKSGAGITHAVEARPQLELFHHALAPVATLPVLEVISGVHIQTVLTLGLGTVIHDYLA